MKRSRIAMILRTAALVLCCLLLAAAGLSAAFAEDEGMVEFTVQWWDVDHETALEYVNGSFDLYLNGELAYDDCYGSSTFTVPASASYEVKDVRLEESSMYVLAPVQSWSGMVTDDTFDLPVHGPRSYEVTLVTSDFNTNEEFYGDASSYRYDVYHDGVLVGQDYSGACSNSCRYGETVEIKNIRTPGGTNTEGAVMPSSYNLSFTPNVDNYKIDLTLPPLFQMDVNMVRNGNDGSSIGFEGVTFDVTVGGASAARNVQDYCAGVPAGLTYEVKNIHIPEGYYPTYTGSRTGTVTGYHEETIGLLTHEWNAATVKETPTTLSSGYLQYTCPHCEETSEPRVSLIHDEGETSVEAILYLSWRDNVYVLTNDNGTLTVAPYAPGSNAQRWVFEALENGGYRILSKADGKAVTLGAYARNGYAYRSLTLAAPDNSTEQIWFTQSDWWTAMLYSAAEPYVLGLTADDDGESPVVCCSDNGRSWDFHEIKDLGAGFTCDFLFSDNESSVSVAQNNVQIGEFSGALSQQWQFTRLTNGAYKITNKQDGKALTAAGAQEGSNVALAAYTGALSQQWYLLQGSDGHFFLQPLSTLCVMDLTDGNTASGTNIQLWLMHYGWQEQWNLQRYVDLGESFTAFVMNAYDSRPVCCAAAGDVEYNLEVHSFVDGIAVPWTFTRLANGGYTISGRDGELVWTYNEATYNVEVSTATGAASQQWFVYHGWDGCYQLRPGGTSRVLDLLNGGSDVDINVQTFTRHNERAEQWSILKATAFPDRFYAEIRVRGTDTALSSDLYEDARLKSYTGSAWQRWLFTKQADGAYTIQNTQDGRTLWINGYGAPVLCADEDASESYRNHWLVTAAMNGGYTLSCARYDTYQESCFLSDHGETVYTDWAQETNIYWDVKVLEELTNFTLSKTSFAFTGSAQRPSVTVKNAAGKVLTAGTDYVLTPAAGSTNVGSYTVKIAGKGDYIGTVSKTYTIVPATVTGLTAAPSAAKEIRLSWTAAPGAGFYYIYQLNAGTGKYEYIDWTSATEFTVGELPAWQNASFEVRSVANVSGTKYYGAYSAPVSVTVPDVPAVPTNVTARPTAERTITVSWDAVTGATQYNVYRFNGTEYKYYGTTPATAANPTQFVNTGLTVGDGYSYKVTAVYKDSGLTLQSGQSAAADATALGTPGVPQNVAVKPTADRQLTVTWNAVKGATKYNVYRWNGSKYVYIGTALDPSGYIDNNRTVGTTYYYKVIAVCEGFGLVFESPMSVSVSAVALGTPGVPQNVKAEATADREITLTWDVVKGATQYNVSRWNGTMYKYLGTTFAGTSYIDRGLTAGTTYYYKVAAVCKGNGLTFVGDLSVSVSAVALGKPGVPANVAVKPTAEKVLTVTWNAVKGATQYNVSRWNGTTYKYLGTTFATDENPTRFVNTGLTVGDTYSYKVTAVCKGNGLTFVGDESEAVSARALGKPGVPQNVKATATAEKTVTVTWNAVKGATQYNVYRWNGTEYKYAGTTFADAEKPTEYADTGRTVGTTYYYKVLAACKGNGLTFVGDLSVSVSAVALGTPAVPTNVAVKPTAEKELTVTWKAVKGATQYNIYRWNGSAYKYYSTTFVTDANPTAFVDGNLTVGDTYDYKVVAVCKGSGLTFQSDKSVAVSAMALGTPAVPTNVAVKPTAAKQLTVTWSAVKGATQYNVYRYNGSAYKYIGTTFATAEKPTEYVDGNLTVGTDYYYKVIAVGKGNGLTFQSEMSAFAHAVALGELPAPTNVAAAASASRTITVSWSAVKGATQYNVYRYNGTEYKYIGTTFATAANPTQYVDSGLTPGTDYYYKVVAVGKGNGLTFQSAKSAFAHVAATA